MQKYKKPNIPAELGINPFTSKSGLVIPIRNVVQPNRYYKDEEGHLINIEDELEMDEYTKFYKSSKRRLAINKLNLRAKELYLWVMQECDTNKDYFWLNHERYMEENGVSSLNTYKEACNDLIKNGFIGLTITKHVYWVNPNYFFAGSRVKRYPENVVKM